MTALSPDTQLPTKDELTLPELELSSPILKAGAHHFGKQCDDKSKEFMLCMSEEKDPRKCLEEGKAVTQCGFKVFRAIRDNCREEFTKYWKCVDYSGRNMELENCRKLQQPFDKCVLDKLGWNRPELGYFSKVRLHDSSRPKPVLPTQEVPEWIPGPNKQIEETPIPDRSRPSVIL